MVHCRALILFAVTTLSVFASQPNAPNPDEAFLHLKHLVGRWEGKFHDGRPHSVTYTLTAGGSALLETWALAPGRESLTLYYMDGSNLMATHYCPQGNQPRLLYVQGVDPSKLSFAFYDGTNLQIKGRSHQHSFWIKLIGESSFARSETYIENGTSISKAAPVTEEEPIFYTRAK